MSEKLKLPKFSVGVGDRFARQAKAQLAATIELALRRFIGRADIVAGGPETARRDNLDVRYAGSRRSCIV